MKIERLYAEIFLQQEVTKARALALCGQIIAELAMIDSEGTTGSNTGYSEPHSKRTQEKTPEPVSAPQGRILAPRGTQCYCTACKQMAYQVGVDVYEKGMSTGAFLRAFNPLGNHEALTVEDLDDVLAGADGSMSIDCACGGKKSLMLIPPNQTQQVRPASPIGSTGVTSISGGEFQR